MSIQPAVRRLNNDIKRLHQAQRELKNDSRELRGDKRALKSDRNALVKDRKELTRDEKTYKKDGASLDKLQSAEDQKLQALEARRATLEQQYEDSFDPSTGEGDPALQGQLDALDQQETDLKASYGAKIDTARQQVETSRDAVHGDRDAIRGKRDEVKSDRKGISTFERQVKGDRKLVQKDRRTALDHLRPAEYKMGLKATNRARSELGLKKVDEVIRPGVPNVVGGQVGKWIAEAQTIMKKAGIPLSKMNAKDIALIIKYESGGNPNATNGWDSNAAAGTPSIGLMQTIGPTFNSYKLPGHGNIRNPVDNIIAGVRYAISRYGSVSNVPGVRAVKSGGAYVGY